MAATEQQPIENELEKLLKDYQILQEQLRSIAMQLEQFQAQKIESERAKEELEKSTGKVYLSVGGVIVETTKENALSDIYDRYALVETRLTAYNKQYTDLRSKEKALNEKITKIYKQSQGQQGVA